MKGTRYKDHRRNKQEKVREGRERKCGRPTRARMEK